MKIRYAEPKSFNLFIAAITRTPHEIRSGAVLLLKLLETIVDRTAEIIENTVVGIDHVAKGIFGGEARSKRKEPRYLEDKIAEIASFHRLVSKVRDSLTSLARVQSFLHATTLVQEDKDAKEMGASIARDIHSLSEHVSYISGNLTLAG